MLTIEASSVVMNVPSATSPRTAHLPFISSPPLSLDRLGSVGRGGGNRDYSGLSRAATSQPPPSAFTSRTLPSARGRRGSHLRTRPGHGVMNGGAAQGCFCLRARPQVGDPHVLPSVEQRFRL